MLPTVASRSSVKKRFPSGSPSRVAEDAKMWMEWKKQLTAYVAWVNSQLKKKLGAHLVEDLRHDVRDGVALINLIEVIAGEKLPGTHAAPSSTAEMQENVEAVLQFMALNKVKMHHITTRDVVEGNLKAIMRLVLALAAHYKPNSVRHSAAQQRTVSQSITGIAQGAAAALTEARRNVTRAGHRHRRRRQREDPRQADPQGSDSDAPPPQPSPGSAHRKSASMSRISPSLQHPPPPRQHRHSYSSSLRVVGEGECGGDRTQLDGASASSSPASSRGTSPRTSLYLSDPPSSMEGLLYNAMNHKGLMMTSCESDTLGDSGFSDICDNLKDTHQLLFRLQELLLSGEGTDASEASAGEMEGSNPHETISILRGRLLHAEEVSGALRSELAKVKKDCMELQGEKAGLQQRLTKQEAELADVKAYLVNVELQHNQQVSELESVRRALGDREQTLADVRASCLKQAQDRDVAVAQLRGELLARDLQLAQMRDLAPPSSPGAKDQVRGLVADLAEGEGKVNRQDRKMAQLSDYIKRAPTAIGEQRRELESINLQLQQARSQLAAAQGSNDQLGAAQSSSTVDNLEDSIVQLLSKLHITTGNTQAAVAGHGEQARGSATPSSAASRDRQKTLGVSNPGRLVNNRSQNQRGAGGAATRPSVTARVQTFSSVRGTPGRSQPQTTSGVGCNKQGLQVSPRPSAAAHSLSRGRPASTTGQRTPGPGGSSIPVAQGQRLKPHLVTSSSESPTTVVYHTAHVEKPSTCVIHKKLGEIRLRDFKLAVGESNMYHYYFKAYDPEYGTVKEEVFQDEDILPGYEGKIMAWLEEEGGTTV